MADLNRLRISFPRQVIRKSDEDKRTLPNESHLSYKHENCKNSQKKSNHKKLLRFNDTIYLLTVS